MINRDFEIVFQWLDFPGFCWLVVDFYTFYEVWIIRSSLFLSLLESLMVGSDGYARFMVGDSLLFLMFVSPE